MSGGLCGLKLSILESFIQDDGFILKSGGSNFGVNGRFEVIQLDGTPFGDDALNRNGIFDDFSTDVPED